MLVLSRHTDDSIVITNEATKESMTVTVVRIRGNTVRLGIDAPRSYNILRDELQQNEMTRSALDGAEG
jgi:carbon storage regulator